MRLPDFLACRELDPGPGAYAELPALRRACLKSQIAMLHKLWLPCLPPARILRLLPGAGRVVSESRPRDWAVFALDAGYASPAGLIAAMLPAVMAGVEELILCILAPKHQGRTSDFALCPALSAALELLGRERAYALSLEEFDLLLDGLAGESKAGCLCSLGDDPTLEHILGRARRQRASTLALPGGLSIALAGQRKTGPDFEQEQALLRWLYPKAEFIYRAGAKGEERPYALPPDALLLDAERELVPAEQEPAACRARAALTLSPGQEAFWLWPELGPEFFVQRNFSFYAAGQ